MVMRKLSLLVILLVLIFSCNKSSEQVDDSEDRIRTTTEFPLRQMAQSITKHSSSNGGFFLFSGNYRSSTYEIDKVKVFAKVDGLYTFIDINLREVRVNINDSLEIPTLQIIYKNSKISDSKLVNYYVCCKYIKYYRINVPEKYFPENLIPINIE